MVNKNLLRLFLLFISFCAAANCPVIAFQKNHTFQDLEKLLMQHDYAVAAIMQKMQAMESRRSAAKAQYLPKLSTSYRFFGDGLNLAEEDFGRKHFLTLRLSQDLVKLTKVRSNKIDGINAELDIIASQLQSSKRFSFLEFRKAYIEILRNHSRIFYYKRLINTYEKIIKIKRSRYEEQEELLTEVLEIEKERINVRGLHAYYQTQIKKQKDVLAEFFQLTRYDIEWNETELRHVPIREAKLLAVAVKNSDGFKLNQAKARLADIRADGSMYDNVTFSPYLGLRIRGDKFNKLHTGPEVGVNFSIPLWLKSVRTNKHNQYKYESNASKLAAEHEAFELKQKVISVLHKYQLLDVQIKNSSDILDLLNEKTRIQESRHANELRNLKLDPVTLLELEAQIAAKKLDRICFKYERDQFYYELIYLAGMTQPKNFAYHLAKNREVAMNQQTKGIWLWNTSEVLKGEPRARFIAFCKSTGINKVFVSINKKVVSSIEQSSDLQTFIAHLHHAGIKAAALMGEPTWVYEKNRQKMLRRLRFVLDYNDNTIDPARFDAIHLDIEPHTLAEWGNYKKFLLNNLAETIKLANNLTSRGKQRLPLEIDIPTFYHKIDKTALEKIVQNADTMTIMAYERLTAERVMKSVENIFALANRMGKRVVIGLNAKEFSEKEMLENLIKNVGDKVSLEKSYAGFAIHDFHHYRNLIEKRNAL